MPPRRRQVGRAEEKKKITTRLMEISLKLDDYVYKQKPIPAADARAHIQEILVYRSKCLNDERCLQVIEKLTHCMNAIIAEDQNFNLREKQDTSHEPTAVVSVYSCPSPTYSITDENEQLLLNAQNNEELNAVKSDGKLLTQIHVDINSDASNNMQTKPFGNNDTETVAIDTIDLCAAEDERDHTFNIDVEMHRVLSNLSIMGMQEDFNTAEKFSQSILDNNTPDLIETRCSNDEITSTRIEKSNQNNSKIIDLTENENLYKQIEVKKVVRFDIKIEESNTIAVSKTQSKSITKSNTQKRNSKRGLNKQTYNVKAKNKTKKEQVKKQKETKNQGKKKDKSASILKTNNSNAPKSTKLITASTDLSCSARKLSGNRNKILVTNVQQAKHDSVSKIYSDNTENDLSWVENIRFVREIQKEEIDNIKLTGLNESFWDDLSFPSDWDDQEFEVN